MNFVRLLHIGFFALLLFAASCSTPTQSPVPQSGDQKSVTHRDINDVLRDHDDELMAIPGVVGVAVGLMDDNKTLCLKVLAVKKSEELLKRIPKSIEGYAVVLEESGVIYRMK